MRAVEKGGEAGFRSLGVGALLGLADWRLEACTVAAHAAYLSRRFWKSRIAVSFPRVNEAEADFDVDYPMSDAELVQMIVGMRLLLPDAELVVSTREPARLRDHIVGLGVTRMSAGSKIQPRRLRDARKFGQAIRYFGRAIRRAGRANDYRSRFRAGLEGF
ncbi:MAG: hypothetical protein M5R36_21505 [Deltaproteobacteria bacterium]|nr:hypothetical protein [Deltaproteobacteria bacterium]